MARDKKAEVHIRLSTSEKENLLSRAEEAHMSLNNYILHLSEQKRIVVADDLPEMIRQIIKIGTNVNQVALVANTYKSVSLNEIESLNDNLNEVQHLLRKVIVSVNGSTDAPVDSSSQQLSSINKNQIEMKRLLEKVAVAVGVEEGV